MNIINNALAILILCALAIVGMTAAMAISSGLVKGQHVTRYDCGMAESHPDSSTEARKKCSDLRSK